MNMKSVLLVSTAILTLGTAALIADSTSAQGQGTGTRGNPWSHGNVENHSYRPSPYYEHRNNRHRNWSYWAHQRESQKRRNYDGHDNGNHYGQKKHENRDNGNHRERNRSDHDYKDRGKGNRSHR